MFTLNVEILMNKLKKLKKMETNLTKNQLTKVGYGEKSD